jgi:hypothetical protein
MEAIFLLAIAAVLWLQAWNYLGFVGDLKTVGLVAIAVALGLLALMTFYPAPAAAITTASGAGLYSLIGLWALYAAILAAVGLWGFEEKALGYYGLLLAVVSFALGLYFLIGDVTAPAVVSSTMGVVAFALGVVSALVFFRYAIPFPRMQLATGWVILVVSIIVAILGVGAILGAVDLTL